MIFVDTSFWVAWRNRRDSHHLDASQLARLTAGQTLVTTNHVRGETWTHLNRKSGHPTAVDFLDSVDDADRLRLVSVTPSQEDAAVAWLRAHDERTYSFVDATSFAVMKSMRITKALAFDGDFSAAGFQELRP